ncbi:MAG: DUF2214 family protein [Crocinitomicaceae bacterium]|nr:DUF2214 family protein [Crocinitomicaceae bacterium]
MAVYHLMTYLHYISIFFVFTGVFLELVLVRKTLSALNFKRVVLADSLYGIFSILVVTTGLLRAFIYGKGSDYYFSNWIFNLKFSLFIVAGLLSIYPTVVFLKERKAQKTNPTAEIEFEKYELIRKFILLEFLILLVIPMLAILMASGIGM